ncbi:flavodoxin [Dechloromonas sp.]|uniref:flavodoxin n=1 Tax=Dechloromonas sp. TaxID=1917218 RepID=UPI00121D0412|nr:flavodoxin [Dechloromonas sp.]MBU3695808.1 flavodoxin [Dechloromonas sp.]TEX48184.1 MAG: flavodoxin [Rhodocyclaceae bacterium]
MDKIGIFFGTDTGRTRLIAKQIAKKLGDTAAAPVNIGRTTLADFLAYDHLIVGSPTLGDGMLPGESCGLSQPSWEEFVPQLAAADLTGKTIAIFGLGDQKKYTHEFVDAIGILHDAFVARGARVVGRWPTAGYDFAASQAVDGDEFLGLALDQHHQPVLTEERIDAWLAQIKTEFLR